MWIGGVKEVLCPETKGLWRFLNTGTWTTVHQLLTLESQTPFPHTVRDLVRPGSCVGDVKGIRGSGKSSTLCRSPNYRQDKSLSDLRRVGIEVSLPWSWMMKNHGYFCPCTEKTRESWWRRKDYFFSPVLLNRATPSNERGDFQNTIKRRK